MEIDVRFVVVVKPPALRTPRAATKPTFLVLLDFRDAAVDISLKRCLAEGAEEEEEEDDDDDEEEEEEEEDDFFLAFAALFASLASAIRSSPCSLPSVALTIAPPTIAKLARLEAALGCPDEPPLEISAVIVSLRDWLRRK